MTVCVVRSDGEKIDGPIARPSADARILAHQKLLGLGADEAVVDDDFASDRHEAHR